MSGEAKLVSVQVLRDLEDALANYSVRVTTALDGFDSEVQRCRRLLEDRRRQAEREVRHRQRVRDEIEEDGPGSAERMLADAEDKLAEIERCVREVDSAVASYRRMAARARDAGGDGVRKARTFLARKHSEAQAYLGLSNAQSSAGDGALRKVAARTTGDAAAPGGGEFAFTDVPLPAGMRWVRLDDIRREDDLPKHEGFPKVSESEIREGFETLGQHILPFMKAHPGSTSSTFFELDQEAGKGYPSGLQRVFEAFFGSEPIVLDTRPEGGLSVTSGRHRIKVARDMGWLAIPAKVI